MLVHEETLEGVEEDDDGAAHGGVVQDALEVCLQRNYLLEEDCIYV